MQVYRKGILLALQSDKLQRGVAFVTIVTDLKPLNLIRFLAAQRSYKGS